jgi:hypothetical protein
MDNIKIVRLQNGEDLIGDVAFRSDDTIDIYQPMVFGMDYRAKNPSLVIKYWLPLQLIKKNEVSINLCDILFITDPTTDFSEYYMHTVGEINDLLDDSDQSSENIDDKQLLDQFDQITNVNNVLH